METRFDVCCPNCKTELEVEIPKECVDDIVSSAIKVPDVRGQIKPEATINVYRINTDHMKKYLSEMAKYYVGSNTKLELVPKYTEKKDRNGVIRSYASLQIAFSEDIIEKKADTSFFASIGNDSVNGKIKQEIYNEMILKFQYTRKEIEEWSKSYKILDEIEEKFGITNKYLEELKMYATPKKVPIANTKENWIIFSAKADRVIESMLQSVATDNVEGVIEIKSVKQINHSLVEYIVYVHPNQTKNDQNPLVKKLLEGTLDKKN